MTSEHVGERAVAYCSGELDDAERTAIERHVVTCTDCRTELDEISVALGAVSGWPRQPSLSPALEDRIVRSAIAYGRGASLGTGGRALWLRSGIAAALLLGAISGAVGFGVGRWTSREGGRAPVIAADSSLRSYMLLLEEPSWPPTQPLARDGYGAWAQAIRAESRFVGAEKFTEEPGFRVTAGGAAARPATSQPNYSGWYIVRARSYDEAIAWARRGPHLTYGSILVREIE
jgi:Putative zinc-finger